MVVSVIPDLRECADMSAHSKMRLAAHRQNALCQSLIEGITRAGFSPTSVFGGTFLVN